MKKTLSILLSVLILLSSCVFFSSCAKVTEKDVEKNAYKTLSEAYASTIAAFFPDAANLNPAIYRATKNGAVTLSLESKTLLGEAGIDRISDTVYVNSSKEKIANDFSFTQNGEEYAARFFMNEEGLVLQSEDLFNQKTGFGLFPESLAENFKSSDLAKLFFADQDLNAIQEVLDQVDEAYEDAFDSLENYEEEAKEAFDRMAAVLKQKVTEENKQVVVSYSITNQTLKALLSEFENEILDPDNEIDQILSEMDDSVEIDLTFSIYLNQKTGLIDQITEDVSFSDPASDAKGTIDIQYTFGEDAIKILLDFNVDGEKGKGEFVLNKKEDDSSVSYTASVLLEDGEEKMEFAPFSYKFEKESGEFTAEFDLREIAEDDSALIVIGGKAEGSADKASIQITSIRYDEITINLDLQILFEANKKMPAEPDETKDVVKLTEDELVQWISDISSSKIAGLFGAQSETDSFAEAV